MAYRVKTGVIGVAVIPHVSGERQSLEELQFEATHQALRDAGLAIDDIDGIVVGATTSTMGARSR